MIDLATLRPGDRVFDAEHAWKSALSATGTVDRVDPSGGVYVVWDDRAEVDPTPMDARRLVLETDRDGTVHRQVDTCLRECANRPAYTLATAVSVQVTVGEETWEVAGRGSDVKYAYEDATVHAYGASGDEVVVIGFRVDENRNEQGCPDCACCTYCGPGSDNDCPFNERLGDSTCPCTSA